MLFDQNDGTEPPTTPVITAQNAAWLPDNTGAWFFHLMTTDAVGNWSRPDHQGPYLVDITPPIVLLQAPAGSDIYVQGAYEIIDWYAEDNSQSGVVSIALDYSTNGGPSWYHIVDLTEPADLALGTYNWHIPYAASDSAVVRVTATDAVGNSASHQNERFFTLQVTSGVDWPDTPELPTDFVLAGNYPNPFNPMTIIRYGVPRTTGVSLRIYNLQGQRIRTLVNTVQNGPAWCEAIWNGQDDTGLLVAAGVYFYRFEAGGFSETRRMVLVK